MIWPFKRRKQTAEPCPEDRLKEAHAARVKSEKDLKRVESLWPEVQSTADELNYQLDKNHIAQRYRAALGGQ